MFINDPDILFDEKILLSKKILFVLIGGPLTWFFGLVVLIGFFVAFVSDCVISNIRGGD